MALPPDRRPIRVTHVVFELDFGGLENVVAAMARIYAGSAVRMSVVSLSGQEGRTGTEIRDLLEAYHIVRPFPVLSLAAPVGVARLLARMAPDVVHLHSGAWLKGALAARRAGVPRVVYTEHGLIHDHGYSRWLYRRAAARTDAVVLVADTLRPYFTDTIGVSADRVRTIANGVDVARFSPGPGGAERRAALGIPPAALVVGSVGRLETIKGHQHLLAAVARLNAQDGRSRPVHLVLCGDGALRADLEAQARALGMAERVHFAGWVDDAVPYYRLFDVFVLPSISEGMPLSLLEAMACGAVPVVSGVGSMPSVLGPDFAGGVVPPGDANALAQALEHMLRVPDAEQSRRSALARTRITEHYSLERMAADYEALYRASEPRVA